ncbi:MAG: hypothetical protein BM556_07875 [Bacteriovorax sp. MedPE-SWde]|nr:MAG: hypothetical protein BM556_07875 [Bacteriovorax sp. MedPE-SWde]
MKKILPFILLVSLVSCSSNPVLYPNKKYKKVGKEAAKKDADKCMADADKFIESSKGKKMLKGAGKGAFVGAAMGAVSGLLFGDFKKAAISGAAIGGTGGAAGSAITPDVLKQRYTNKCLARKGYEIVGWD